MAENKLDEPIPVAKAAAGLVAVTFTRPVREGSCMYNSGETAGFTQEHADFLVAKGFAVLATPPKTRFGKPGPPTEGAQA